MRGLSRYLTYPAGRRGKWWVLGIVLFLALSASGNSSKFEKAQKNETTSFLPGGAESIKVFDKVKQLNNGQEVAAAVVIYSRHEGLTAADKARIARDRASLTANHPVVTAPPTPAAFSPDGRAALYQVQVKVNAGDSTALKNAVKDLRHRVSGTHDGLQTRITGPAGYSYDAIKVFGNINGTLLIVAGGLVLFLLIAIYRSPIFWAIPFLTVLMAEATSRGLGYLLAKNGVTINGQSGGILPVLVFGAGTDYALLLVSRFREELRHVEDKHEAMRRALLTAGPAIVAAALTVVCALFTLTLAQVNGTAGLGPVGAMGVGLAAIFMLTLLPALLTIFGRRAFWPFVPHVGDVGADVTHGPWRRIGERVRARPRRVWVAGALVLVALTAGMLGLNTGLTQGNSFRGDVESVQGQRLLEASFPAGSAAPADVFAPDQASATKVIRALLARKDLVAGIAGVQRGASGIRILAVLAHDPATIQAIHEIPALRRAVKAAGGPDVLVGGQTAATADLRTSAARDDWVIIPIALLVVFLILAGLLRAIAAPLLLVGSVVLSFGAALGTGVLFVNHVFHYPGIDPSLPLMCFVFLVALGIDYNIFLMARVREETQRHGTGDGMLRGLAVTGTVITSAGIVLAGTFGALAVLPLIFLTELGFIIAFGVLLDTFVVRSIIVPALVFDLDRRIWWPSSLDRGGPARAEEEREPAEVGAL
jgi:RND superfamily putative drug exporter